MLCAVLFISASLFNHEDNQRNDEKKKKKESEDEVDEDSDEYLFFVSSRLSFGWALQNLVGAIVASIVVLNNPVRIWLVVIVEFILAVIAMILGAQLHLYYQANVIEQKEEGNKGVGIGPTNLSEALI
eukprot:CAMPEP_0170070026 /NCGR_PEP_ID=MMETSP0019_2-20121128/8477_1 /TAXON_ID=98059 /ORGANISM="Dinobryon sp., Strain UTEXLB2267" /LENGTH=127 /DNA_ID=CAMNT_0010278211 /DNA_START=627 /DNA_END=1010 /DNA_ORIENTATION=+